MGSERRNSERWLNVPEVDAVDNMQYNIYGIRSGQKRGMAQRKKNVDTQRAMQSVCQSTTKVWSLRCKGTFMGAHRIALLSHL